MSTINDYVVAPVYQVVEGIGGGLKKGTLFVGEGISQIAYDVYDLKNEGFEKWVKFSISIIQVTAVALGHGDRYNLAIKDFEAQKDLYYATKVFVNLKDLTRNGIGGCNLASVKKCLYAASNVLDTAKFLKKQEIFEMQWANEASSRIGSISLSSLHIESFPVVGEWLNWKTIADVPVLNSFTRTPKDFFIFMACLIEVGELFYKTVHISNDNDDDDVVRANMRWAFVTNKDNILKLISSIGKIVLIAGGKSNQMHWFAVAALIANGASWAQYNRKCAARRQLRFDTPAAAAAAAA
ncbi:MAG: hypothetical protein LW832_08710 [Parachlamydia sp.]|jgi:hypothetical protein|nr:hypothetical protein [Parachlamydia sp.]